jgi:pyruvate/2-oxoglutarate/acetoin dehydrogenase E1 component
MEKNLRQTIKDIIQDHLLKKGGKVFGQSLTAVGWVGGTLPELYEKDGMIELSMADVAGGGIVVGAGLMMTRPIYVIRYQGFNWYNCPMIVNYACKSNEIWKKPCPILVRGIAMEGRIGPVAGSSHHSLYYRMPGVKIVSPMTPKEYKKTYEYFMKNDEVMYVSEHRGSYDNTRELNDIIFEKSDLVIFAISITRFESLKAHNILKNEGINISVINMFWIKPFKITKKHVKILKESKFGGLVIDDDYEDGVAKSIANDLGNISGRTLETFGLKNKTAGFSKKTDNLPPSASKIVEKIKRIISEKKNNLKQHN